MRCRVAGAVPSGGRGAEWRARCRVAGAVPSGGRGAGWRARCRCTCRCPGGRGRAVGRLDRRDRADRGTPIVRAGEGGCLDQDSGRPGGLAALRAVADLHDRCLGAFPADFQPETRRDGDHGSVTARVTATAAYRPRPQTVPRRPLGGQRITHRRITHRHQPAATDSPVTDSPARQPPPRRPTHQRPTHCPPPSPTDHRPSPPLTAGPPTVTHLPAGPPPPTRHRPTGRNPPTAGPPPPTRHRPPAVTHRPPAHRHRAATGPPAHRPAGPPAHRPSPTDRRPTATGPPAHHHRPADRHPPTHRPAATGPPTVPSSRHRRPRTAPRRRLIAGTTGRRRGRSGDRWGGGVGRNVDCCVLNTPHIRGPPDLA